MYNTEYSANIANTKIESRLSNGIINNYPGLMTSSDWGTREEMFAITVEGDPRK